MPQFVEDLDKFVLDRTLRPRLEGAYETSLEISGTATSVTLGFCIADAFCGYRADSTTFTLAGSFDIEQDQISSVVTRLRELIDPH